jgi:hypothetical protein
MSPVWKNLYSNWNRQSIGSMDVWNLFQAKIRTEAQMHVIHSERVAIGQAQQVGERQLILLVLGMVKTEEVVELRLEEGLGVQGGGG